jgi:hypothetical protein
LCHHAGRERHSHEKPASATCAGMTATLEEFTAIMAL